MNKLLMNGCMTFDNKQVNITILRTQELNNLKSGKDSYKENNK